MDDSDGACAVSFRSCSEGDIGAGASVISTSDIFARRSVFGLEIFEFRSFFRIFKNLGFLGLHG
jgi:hypothetical protein